MVAQRVVHLLEVIQVDDKQSRLGFHAARALQRDGEAVEEKSSVGQAREFIVEREIFVVLDLIFKQKEDHADGDNILGKIPDLTLDLSVGHKDVAKRRQNENHGPTKETDDRDQRTCTDALAIAVPDMDTATEVDSE